MTLLPVDNPPVCIPEDLFAARSTAAEIWWVARTKSRQEKALAWSLKGLGISYFLPLVPRPQEARKRLRVSILPLFPGYLFFRGDLTERAALLKTGRAAQVIEVEDQQGLAVELARIQHVIAGEQQLELCDFVSRGKRVRIIDGPLAGLEGIVQTVKKKTRLVLQIDAIRQAAAVEIDLNQTAPAK